MALTQVTGPYPIFTDLDGSPLDDGYLYIGEVNQDPETNPIQVYWDSALTIPATQPIRTSNGYAYRNGTPALLYTGGEFSITIRNKRNEFVLYSPVGYGFDPGSVSASVTKNDFIGDGVEVDFAISATPTTILATNVFINGVYQEKDSYSLLGNVITFSVAPPLNSSIEILTNQTGVINTGNATDITYTAGFPGAVQQTVQTKLEQYVSVKDFGAVGDGVTDDTAAIQAALNATIGGVLNLVAGETYLVSSPLDVNGSIDGHGASILGQIQVSAGDVIIRDVNVVSPAAVYGVYIKGLSTARIANVQLLNVGVSFSGGTPGLRLGVLAQYVDSLVIDDCRIDYGANLIRCFDYRFTGNTLNGYNVNENELLHATVRSYGIISGNTFLNSFDNWMDLYSSGERTVVTGNRFDGCQCRLGTGIEIKVTLTDNPDNTSGGPNDYGYTQYIVFSDNFIGSAVQSVASATAVINIYYLDLRSAPSFLWSETPQAILISGNVFDGFDTTAGGGQVANVILIDRCEAITIADNIFKNIHVGGTPPDVASCVWVEGCKNVSITGNYMTTRSCSGVTLHRDCDSIVIDGNLIVTDPSNSYTPSYGIYAVKYGSRPVFALTNSIVSNNRLDASIASMRGLNTNGSFADLVFTSNICANEVVLENATRCNVSDNVLGVSSTRFKALGLGFTGGIVAFNRVSGNTVKSPSGSPKVGIELTRCRASIVSQNTVHTASNGIQCVGTNTAGELNYLVIKDNFSVSQTGLNFPYYVSMNAADTATLVADTNQKVT